MSWLGNIEATPDPTYVDENPKVADPGIPNRMVSTKGPNKPFLAYRNYREHQKKLHDEWLERKKEREAKLAKGEDVGPEEPDPTAEHEVGLTGLLKFFVYVFIFILLSGKFITGDFLWGYEGRWAQVKSYWPSHQRLLSEKGLAYYDGSDADRPIFLAIDGDVYDVTTNRRVYGAGGSYALMAGVDAARAFGTGCFKEHRTHDLRGLTEDEMRGVNHWKKFFKDHKSYPLVGRVQHPPIDLSSPIPVHCDPKKEAASKARQAAEAKAKPAPAPAPAAEVAPEAQKPVKHEEL
ncbi:cytochrome b5 [Auriscalpium vulgare]|uniref:Cytochrome b5 n=1 Tax=Auriscalpium vulgare TaxID=40419 RepID=A0ACB8S8P2_9AGAM|nr:cytochrome b5 [Auriscalpium vulgare]